MIIGGSLLLMENRDVVDMDLMGAESNNRSCSPLRCASVLYRPSKQGNELTILLVVLWDLIDKFPPQDGFVVALRKVADPTEEGSGEPSQGVKGQAIDNKAYTMRGIQNSSSTDKLPWLEGLLLGKMFPKPPKLEHHCEFWGPNCKPT